MKKNTPVDPVIVKKKIEGSGLRNLGQASIRELVKLVNQIEKATGVKYVRMEMGVPGLLPPSIGIEAEIAALKDGVASVYPNIEGLRSLKEETSRFLKLFLNTDVLPRGCIPTVGSMMGGMVSFLVANRNDHTKEGTLFIDPGFPVQKQQVKMLGHDFHSFDVYNYRGKKLKEKLESYLVSGKISSILYSNPNNPTWICLTEEELKIIGDLANKYDVIVIEDLAYFGMDFRKDYSKPGQPPFQPTVAKYTNDYILLISCSKIFSYAGQRVGMMAISDHLFEREYPDLLRYFTSSKFGHSIIFGALYGLSSGVTHSAQYGLAALFKAVNDGEYKYLDDVREYGEKARIMKKLFTSSGFRIPYDRDMDEPIADGFYFTISYPGMTGEELLKELLYYGVSAISLDITGSARNDGLRACVSQVPRDQFGDMEVRLKRFHEDHPLEKE
ncbi:MAG: pyridoxal phosphate-dependent aminotransferase [Bacteroidales bacterium]|jgi:aspartate/methionine/tyrosine aminotransferase